MAVSNEAKITVRIDGKDAQVSVKQLGKSIQTAMKKGQVEAKKFKNTLGDLGNIMKGAFALWVGKDLINASNEQEQAIAGMEQALKSMGRYTDEFSGKLQGLASQIQSEGVIGDEAIIEGTKFLATYRDITDDLMPDAMRTMADLAALTGGDVATSANLLGKASMGLTGQLSRYGITLSDSAKKSGDFALILKEIQTQVGGQNKALSETSAGGLKQFSNMIGDLKEKGGDLLKIFIGPFLKLITPMANLINSLDQGTLMMIGTMGLAAATIWKVVIPAMTAFGVTSKAAMGWVGAIIAAIQLLYMAYQTNFMGMKDVIDQVWPYVEGYFRMMWNSVKQVWNLLKPFFDYILSAINKVMPYIAAYFKLLWDGAKRVGAILVSFADIVKGVFTGSWDDVKKGFVGIKEAIVGGWDETLGTIKETLTTAVDVKDVVTTMFSAGEEAGKSLKKGITSGIAGGGTDGDSALGDFGLTEQIRGVKAEVVEFTDTFVEVEDVLESNVSYFSNWRDKLANIIKSLQAPFEDVFYRMVTNGENKIKSFAQAFEALGDAVKRAIAQIAAELAAKAVIFGLISLLFPGSGIAIGGFGKFLSLASGGYTGDGNKNDAAGVVHRGEFVVNAAATKMFRPMLELLNGRAGMRAIGGAVLPGYQAGGLVAAGGVSAFSDSNIVNELRMLRQSVLGRGSGSQAINVNVGAEQLYSTVAGERETEKIRMGTEINASAFD